jgi:hypothetical protein
MIFANPGLQGMMERSAYGFDKSQQPIASVPYQRMQPLLHEVDASDTGFYGRADFSLSRHTTAPRHDFSSCIDPSAESLNAFSNALPLFWWQPW